MSDPEAPPGGANGEAASTTPTPNKEPAPKTPVNWTRAIGYPAGVVALTGFLVGLATLGLLWNTMFAQMPNLPNKAALWTFNRAAGIEFVDADDKIIAVRGPYYGRAVKLSELPSHVPNAFIAAEDKRFRVHEGVDRLAIVRAVLENLRHGHTVQGGSTITQQLVKNLFLTPDQTLKRKAQEARLAVELEGMLSKDEILELYLNRIYLGSNSYGLDAAAHTYFDTDPQHLTLGQAAMLAAFPKAPTRFAQIFTTPAAKARQGYVLDQMVDMKFITRQEADATKAQKLFVAPPKPDLVAGNALDWSVDQVRNLAPKPPPDLVVKLTLDLGLQAKAQAAVNARIAEMGPERHASQAAVVVLDDAGAVKALVGGLDYGKSQFNRAVQARRQPGSAFKMFVYATALEQGFRPSTVRYDEPISIRGWKPHNYGESYRGAVTLSEALAESLNTVAAQIGVESGLNNVVALARRFGIRSELHPYPSMTLGSDEVTLIDLTSAYAVLANSGRKTPPYIIAEMRNSRGEVLFTQAKAERPVVYKELFTEEMTGMLSRVVVEGTGKRAQIPGWDVAGKTGTSQDWRDAWFIGYTAKFTGGVWVGNDDDTPMRKVTGGELPAAIWSDVMKVAHEGLTPVPLPGAHAPVETLDPDQMARLTFYRRLSSAFSQVEARAQPNL